MDNDFGDRERAFYKVLKDSGMTLTISQIKRLIDKIKACD